MAVFHFFHKWQIGVLGPSDPRPMYMGPGHGVVGAQTMHSNKGDATIYIYIYIFMWIYIGYIRYTYIYTHTQIHIDPLYVSLIWIPYGARLNGPVPIGIHIGDPNRVFYRGSI